MPFAGIRRASLILLLVISLSFSAYSLFGMARSWNSSLIGRDEVSNWENRFHPLKQQLPVGIEQVGYLSERDMPTGHFSGTDQSHEFNLTIYAMAPVIVRRGANSEWIIGNFGTRKFEAWLQGAIGAHETENIGGGIYLIHRVNK